MPFACPRCQRELAPPATQGAVCASCGGRFCERSALELLLREAQGSSEPGTYERPVLHLDARVRYISCPVCQQLMNRRNFSETSGVVVDVCTAHGVWFDSGELERVLAFCASGGLARAEAAAAERAQALQRLDRLQQGFPLASPAQSDRWLTKSDMVELLLQALFF